MKTNNNMATVQFQDFSKKKIITGKIIEETEKYIVIKCDYAQYWINKNMVEWIKYDR